MDKNKPNLIYIFADDMGYGDVSCLNRDAQFKTACIDRLAAEGIRCTDAHSSSAVCTPSRYSVLTGRYNWRSVLKQGVTGGYSQSILEDGRLTIASMLREEGYRTACIGKWHLGLNWKLKDGGFASTYQDEDAVDFASPFTRGPLEHGFDYYFGISASLDMPPYVYLENDRAQTVPTVRFPGAQGQAMMRSGLMAEGFEAEAVLPELTERVETLIEKYSAEESPFFIYFPLPSPHTPIVPTEAFQGKSKTNGYGDFCLQVDDTVGRIMQALERNDLTENTIVVFTADNGCSPKADFEALAELGHHPSYVFRGHKADIYEGGHRVPCIIRWPLRIPADIQTEQTVCLGDLVATMADIVGYALPDDAAEDSVSNLPLWEGQIEQSIREATVHHSIDGSFSIRKGRWKLEMCPGSGGWSHPKPGSDEEAALPAIQLYDLSSDIGERSNVGEQHPDVVGELKTLLSDYIRNGRSTPGVPQLNTGPAHWPQLHWMEG